MVVFAFLPHHWENGILSVYEFSLSNKYIRGGQTLIAMIEFELPHTQTSHLVKLSLPNIFCRELLDGQKEHKRKLHILQQRNKSNELPWEETELGKVIDAKILSRFHLVKG